MSAQALAIVTNAYLYRKKDIQDYIFHTRTRLLRLLGILKWLQSNTSQTGAGLPVRLLGTISAALSLTYLQAFVATLTQKKGSLIAAADTLFHQGNELRMALYVSYTLPSSPSVAYVLCRLPAYPVAAAASILSRGSLQGLPAMIKVRDRQTSS